MPTTARRLEQSPCAPRPDGPQPRQLPAPPRVALRVLRACSDADVDAAAIGAIVEQDPALTAEILRVVNSSYFGFSQRVATVRHAVSILGQRALRNYVLCLAMRDALSAEALHGLDTTRFWEGCLRRGVAGRLLATAVGADPEMAFTACLLQDVGLLAIVYRRPDGAGLVDALLDMDPEDRLDRERQAFATSHDAAGLALARDWELPDELSWAMGAHHHLERAAPSDEAGVLARVAACADWMATVFDTPDKRRAIARSRALLGELWDLSEQAADGLLEGLGAQIREAGRALGIQVVCNETFDAVLREAHLALAEENLGYQQLAWRLQQALDEREAVSRRLRDEVEKARQVQRALLPGPGDGTPFAGINAPALELSGDFFDYFRTAKGQWCFCLGDVAGKGMDAALLMSKITSLFHCLGKALAEPGRLLRTLNAELCELNVGGTFVTMIAGVLDPVAGRVWLANAGHPPALLIDDGGRALAVRAGAPPLGVLGDCEFPVEEHALAARRLYLYSDGVMEAAEASGERHGPEAVLDLIRNVVSPDHREQPARLVNALARPGQRFDDDLTVLVVSAAAAARP